MACITPAWSSGKLGLNHPHFLAFRSFSREKFRVRFNPDTILLNYGLVIGYLLDRYINGRKSQNKVRTEHYLFKIFPPKNQSINIKWPRFGIKVVNGWKAS